MQPCDVRVNQRRDCGLWSCGVRCTDALIQGISGLRCTQMLWPDFMTRFKVEFAPTIEVK